MRSLVSPAFRKMLEKLPEAVREEARAGFEKWKQDPQAVGWKRLKGPKAELYSVEIGRRYRAIACVDKSSNAAVWLFVGSHETYNNWISIHIQPTQSATLASFADRLSAQRAPKQQGEAIVPSPSRRT